MSSPYFQAQEKLILNGSQNRFSRRAAADQVEKAFLRKKNEFIISFWSNELQKFQALKIYLFDECHVPRLRLSKLKFRGGKFTEIKKTERKMNFTNE